MLLKLLLNTEFPYLVRLLHQYLFPQRLLRHTTCYLKEYASIKHLHFYVTGLIVSVTKCSNLIG